MNRPALFSDLDQTMVYSHRAIVAHGQSIAGNLCVEQIKNEPWTFISPVTWKLLVENAGTVFDFIPVTTRTWDQYRRLTLPDVTIKYAVILNGAKLLIDGVEDDEWSAKVAGLLSALPVTPTMVYDRIREHAENWEEVKSVTNASDSFVYVVAKNADVMTRLESYMKELAEETGYVYSKQSRKVYLLPPDLTKGAAVEELRRRLNTTRAYSTGDTLLDFTMHSHSDLFLRPLHAETLDGVEHYTTEKHGVHASEDIVRKVLEDIT